ncbi:acyltransferase family protein [Pyramidobacter sp.]|uniref:acyltransferase family protein n=1 Tax=Pyramidobacter sp. TaxID=1943581 RepID=UPI00345A0925
MRIQSFDALKGIACIAVVFIHYNFPGNLGLAVKAFCRLGVPVFFVISGYFCWERMKRSRMTKR